MTPADLRVGLVIVSYRSRDLTARLLQAAAGGADDVVVVDCTPHEPGLDAVVQAAGATLVDPGANVGYGAGANLGVGRLSACDVVVVANADLTIAADDLRRLAARAKGVGLAAPRFEHPDGSLQLSAHRAEPRGLTTVWDLSVPFGFVATRLRPGWNPTLLRPEEHAEARDVAHVLGALLAVDAGAFVAVGGFDEDFFLYREETDLCRRLRGAGWRVRHEPSITAVHELHGSTPGVASRVPSPQALDSHFRYIEKHWGRGSLRRLQALGVVATLTSVVSGPERPRWWASLLAQLGRR